MRALPALVLALSALGVLIGCNSRDAKELSQDAGKLGKTLVRSGTNAQLAGRVNGQLAQTKGISMEGLKVEAENGVVTLSGKIRNEAERNKIVRAVKDIRGVEKVVNKTTIGR